MARFIGKILKKEIHGTDACYTKTGCRCQLCREAHRDAARKSRAIPSNRATYNKSMNIYKKSRRRPPQGE